MVATTLIYQCCFSCDIDIDGDLILNTEDNCVYIANPAQENKDKDFKGDLCDDSKSWPEPMVSFIKEPAGLKID